VDQSRIRITPTKDGPYRVEGADSITRLRDDETLDMPARAFLCRCGGSARKPFCDGTHKRNGFNDAKDPERVADRRDDYATGKITIHDNRGLCAHSGRCTDNLASVFKLSQEPWIDPSGATVDEIIAVIGMCPSGALSYSVDGREQRERGGASAVAFVPGGPYVVSGGVELDGADLPVGATTDHMALCRCGASQNKPFCSGKHWDVTFDEDAGAS
jgi:CDGSH-type Zn-finger protein